MQNNTKTKKKIAPVVVGIVVTAVLIPVVLVLLAALGIFPLTGPAELGWLVVPILAGYALVVAAVIVGVLAAMRQRLREIDGGEEDAAKIY